MATDVQPESENGVIELLRGIFQDLQELFRQQLALLKYEIRRELIRTALAAGMLVAGGALALVGAALLLLMSVHLLSAVSGVPLWGGYGIVGAGAILLAAGLLWFGKKRLSAAMQLPVESARALMENLECLMGRK